MTETQPDIPRQARDLIRQSVTAALATELGTGDGDWPYASFVTVASEAGVTVSGEHAFVVGSGAP